jgi:hypothetical protein
MKARLACALALTLLGCQTTGCKTSDGAGAGAGPPAPSASASASAAASAPAPTVSAAPAAERPAPPSGDPTVLTLTSGATLKMPAGARAKEMKAADKRLPGQVKQAYKYELTSDGKRLMLVNEMDREGMTCQALLDRELERANKAKEERDPQKLALREMKGVTAIEIGGHRALWAESLNKPGSAAEGKMGVATLMMCRDEDYLVLMVAGTEPVAPDDTKTMLTTIAASYAAKK